MNLKKYNSIHYQYFSIHLIQKFKNMETFSAIPEHGQSSPFGKMVSRDLSDSASHILSTSPTISSMNVFATQPQLQFKPIAQKQEFKSDSTALPQNFTEAGNLISSFQVSNKSS